MSKTSPMTKNEYPVESQKYVHDITVYIADRLGAPLSEHLCVPGLIFRQPGLYNDIPDFGPLLTFESLSILAEQTMNNKCCINEFTKAYNVF